MPKIQMQKQKPVSKEDYYCFPVLKGSLGNGSITWYLDSGASEHLVKTKNR